MNKIVVGFLLAFLVCGVSLFGQNSDGNLLQQGVVDTLSLLGDSLDKNKKDSLLIEDLKLQIQELKLNEILIHNEYSEGRRQSHEEDSILKARKKAQIDSLRHHTQGVPLVVEEDTLFSLYTKRGGVTPHDRVGRAHEVIMTLGRRLTLNPDSLYIYDSEYATDIMSGDQVIITLTDQDGLWQNVSRQELAEMYLPLIYNKVKELHSEYGLMMKLKSILLSIFVIALFGLSIFFVNKLFKRIRKQIFWLMHHKLKPISIKNYEFLNVSKQARVAFFFVGVIRLFIIAILFFICISILFYIFPETKGVAYTLFSYVWHPVKEILGMIGGYFPKLVKIIIIYFCFKYLVRGVKYVTNEIAVGNLQISGFYADWAYPTYYILRFLLYSFMFIMIWPLLPDSDSGVFQGVSVFVGLIISLGSTTVIGNLMAGMVLTYMRSFRIGDQIKMNDVVGMVIEKTPFITRIRTRQNEIVAVPNSTVMSAQTINYTMSIEKQAILVTVELSVGYEIDKQEVRDLLLEAAAGAKGVLTHPKAFVLIPRLEDFYCLYQLNAYTKDIKTLARVQSNLNECIIDKFNEAGVELLSAHFMAQRDGSEIMMPPQYKKK